MKGKLTKEEMRHLDDALASLGAFTGMFLLSSTQVELLSMHPFLEVVLPLSPLYGYCIGITNKEPIT